MRDLQRDRDWLRVHVRYTNDTSRVQRKFPEFFAALASAIYGEKARLANEKRNKQEIGEREEKT